MASGERWSFGSEDARRFYDRFGARQDRQARYEDAALDALVRHGRFGEARRVLELGCGTGRFAARLLGGVLPADATYLGLDLSATMVGLARDRLAAHGARAEVCEVDGAPAIDVEDESVDRFVATYVFDLLPRAAIAAWLHEAWRALGPDGLLCTANLTAGPTLATRVVSSLWGVVHALRPSVVGGCRPLALVDLFDERAWEVLHREVVAAAGLASEVLVARRLEEPRAA